MNWNSVKELFREVMLAGAVLSCLFGVTHPAAAFVEQDVS